MVEINMFDLFRPPSYVTREILDEKVPNQKRAEKLWDEKVWPATRRIGRRGIAISLASIGIGFIGAKFGAIEHFQEGAHTLASAADVETPVDQNPDTFLDGITIAGLSYIVANSVNRSRSYRNIERMIDDTVS
ncbi:MAG: hypothetical protein ACREGC_00830 [Minisyncoccia bacterium]